MPCASYPFLTYIPHNLCPLKNYNLFFIYQIEYAFSCEFLSIFLVKVSNWNLDMMGLWNLSVYMPFTIVPESLRPCSFFLRWWKCYKIGLWWWLHSSINELQIIDCWLQMRGFIMYKLHLNKVDVNSSKKEAPLILANTILLGST